MCTEYCLSNNLQIRKCLSGDEGEGMDQNRQEGFGGKIIMFCILFQLVITQVCAVFQSHSLNAYMCFSLYTNCIFFKIYLFIFGCIGSSLLCTGFLQLWRAGATLRCGAQASHCSGFSCCGARALGARASVVVARRLSSYGAQAQFLYSMWDLPGPGIEPVYPALADGFSTTAPPGKPH